MSDKNDCLKYKLLGHTDRENIEAWGHEYIRHLSGEIVSEWNSIGEADAETEEGVDVEMADNEKKEQLLHLVKEIIPSQVLTYINIFNLHICKLNIQPQLWISDFLRFWNSNEKGLLQIKFFKVVSRVLNSL